MGIKKWLHRLGIATITVVYNIWLYKNKDKNIKKIFTLPWTTVSFTKNPLFNWRESIKHFDHIVYQLDWGKVYWCYTVATAENEIIWDLTRRHNTDKSSNLYAYKLFPNKTTFLWWTTAIVTGNDTDKNYHHRLTVSLPKFYLFQQSWVSIDQYIVDTNYAFHQESLDALWIKTDTIVSSHKDTYYQCEKLLATNSTTIYGLIQPRVKEFVQQLFLSKKSDSQSNRKIYIKRITNRKIANEKEFEALMQQQWIEIVAMEWMTIKEQAILFSEANLIIWPHGAWLTNIIFSNPWSTLIELFHPETIFWHYYAMAWSLDIQYIPIIWETVKDNKRIAMDQDMIIDCNELKIALHNIS